MMLTLDYMSIILASTNAC